MYMNDWITSVIHLKVAVQLYGVLNQLYSSKKKLKNHELLQLKKATYISLSLIVWQRHCLWVCGSHPQLTVNLGYSALPWSAGSWWLPFHWNYNMFLCSLVQGDSWGRERNVIFIHANCEVQWFNWEIFLDVASFSSQSPKTNPTWKR